MEKKPDCIRERTFRFAVRIVRLTHALYEKNGIAKVLGTQLLRAGTSVGANMAESFGSQSEADYLTKCSISCKEARETLFWLRLLQETGLQSEYKLSEIIRECDEIVAILTVIIRKLKAKKDQTKKR